MATRKLNHTCAFITSVDVEPHPEPERKDLLLVRVGEKCKLCGEYGKSAVILAANGYENLHKWGLPLRRPPENGDEN